MALLEAFCAFFWPPFPEALFSLTLVCCLLPRHLSKWTPAKRCKTRGFGAISRLCASSIPCGVSKKTSFCGPVLRIIFCGCYYFVRFDVRVFVEFGFQRSKNPWGCRTELVLKRVFFAVCPLRAQIWRAGGARRCRFFPWFSGASHKWPRGCGAEGFSVFFGFFFGRRFRKLHVVLFPSLSLFLGVFLFCSHSSWDWWQRRIARVFLGSWLSTLLIFWGLLKKALFFALKKGYLGSFLSVSLLCLPFVLLGFFHFSLSLSLSLYLSFFLLYCFFFFLVVLFLFLPSWFYCCYFLSCCFVFVSWEEQHQHITFESFIFIIYVCLFFCFVFQICSYLCFFVII